MATNFIRWFENALVASLGCVSQAWLTDFRAREGKSGDVL